jgi:molecular chaperone GrpE
MTNQQDDTQPADDETVDDTTEIDRLKDMAARAQADLQNAKARMEKEAVDIRMYAMQAMIERLLPTVDNFQRAFEHLPDDLKDHDWVKGLQATEQQLMKDLDAVGLKKIESMGEAVNPEHHEILQAAEGEKDTVIQVLEDGYTLNGKVIRAAKVVVGQG